MEPDVDPVDAIAWMLAARHDVDIASTPEYREAVGLIEADPALQERFQAEKAFYEEHEDYLAIIRMPEVARERIKSALRSALKGGMETPAHAGSRIIFRWRPLAAAAAVVALLSVGYLALLSDPPRPGTTSSGSPNLESFGDFAAEQVASGWRLDFEATQAENLLAWLDRSGGVANVELDRRFDGLKTMGCKTYSWQGRPVSLLCFAAENGTVHLFVTASDSMSGAEIASAQKGVHATGRNTLSWVNGPNAYVLVAHKPGQPLDAFSI